MSIVGAPSEKQLKSFQESDAKINIWEGAVRSGKTYISLWRFIHELARGPEGEYVLICRTYDSFKRNVLPQLALMIGADAKYFKGNREMKVYDKTVHIVGADDERAESKIRGPTFAGAYVDEITIIPESVFKMLISRCAMKRAKIFGTTNPDSPYHWLKRDYLTDNPDVSSWQFTLDDNPQLSPEDRNYLKRQYTGLWYKRFIEGKWVQAENSVYDYFDEKLHVIDFAPSYTSSYFVGIDYGTTNPCAFVLIGHDPSRYPNLWVEDEYYFNSRKHQRQKTDTEYAEDLKKFLQNRPIKSIYLDPSAVSFRMELQKQGIQNLYEAKNEVLDGIRFVSKLLNNGTLKICRSCYNLIQEFQSYVWDIKSSLTGVDKPKKENDHCLTGDTLVWTNKGKIEIKNLVGMKGLVRCYDTTIKNRFTWSNFQNVAKTREKQRIYKVTLKNGKTVRATSDHKLLTKRGYIEIQHLLPQDEVMCYAVEYSAVNSIKEDGVEDVYCLNVPRHGNFVVNDGVVVKNCLDALRYALFTHLFGRDGGTLSAQDIDDMYNESRGVFSHLPRFFQDDDFGMR